MPTYRLERKTLHTMKHTLTISDPNEGFILQMDIPPVDPMLAYPAIIAALAKLPQPKPARKPRSDKGIARKEAQP